MKALTTGQKNVVDTILGIAGLFCGWLVTNVATLAPEYQAIGSIAGLAGGYLVSDALTFVNAGSLPSGALQAQALAVWQASKTPVVDEIKSLVNDPTQQKIALAVIASIEQQLTAQLQVPVTPVSPLAAAVSP